MSDLIQAKVARVLNSREISITAGKNNGVSLGMLFDVMDPKGEDITDPDTDEVLGSLLRPKVRVKVIQVQEKLAVASTYKKKRVNIGGSLSLGVDIGAFSRALMPPKYEERFETLKTDEQTWEDLDEDESFVKTGDPVVQVQIDEEQRTSAGEKKCKQFHACGRGFRYAPSPPVMATLCCER